MLSFIIPAYNEERCLDLTLRSLDAAAREVGEPFEVIVVNDASTDRTAAIAREHGVRVIDVEHRKIAAVRNSGARAAQGEVLFFIDADTQATGAAVRAGLRALRQGAAGGGCAFRYDGPIPMWARMLHPIGVWVGRRIRLVGGCFLFCRREAFDAAGGFCEDYYAAEEIAFIKALKRHGRFVVPLEMVLTSNRKLNTMSPWWAVRLLIRAVVRGPDSFRRREGLELWYGPEARDTLA